MNMFLTELSNDIWDTEGFQEDYSSVLVSNLANYFRVDSGQSTGPQAERSEIFSNLSRAASAFVYSDRPEHRNAAYHVAVAAIQDRSLDLSAIGFSILEKLGNFPAIDFGFREGAPMEGLDLRLASLALDHEDRNRIRIGERDITLTNFQGLLWEKLIERRNVVASAPTSAGKSFVVLNYVAHRLLSGEVKAICYIVPSRALITQVSRDLRELLIKIAPNSPIRLSTVPNPPELETTRSIPTVYVLTQERLHLLLDNAPETVFQLVVVDEAQNISAGGRGVLLYSAIARLAEKSPDVQEVFVCPYAEVDESFRAMFPNKNFASVTSEDGAVVQNLIRVDIVEEAPNCVELFLLNHGHEYPLGSRETPINLVHNNYAPVLATQFGEGSSNLIYSGGPARCESVADMIAQGIADTDSPSPARTELAELVERVIHPKFRLAASARKGVGFHYGRLPGLVRKEIESAFSSGALDYLVTTSTLLYGVNLPAKNLFIDQPTKGTDEALSGPEFWNLVGRAGRLGKEFEGNIFLINLKNWQEDLTKAEKSYSVHSALAKQIIDGSDELADYISDVDARSGQDSGLENTAVKLYLDYVSGRIDQTLDSLQPPLSRKKRDHLLDALQSASTRINLQAETVQRSPTVTPSAQQRLKDYLTSKVLTDGPKEVIPMHPLSEWNDAYVSYLRIFRRIHLYIEGRSSNDQSHKFFAPQALLWMRGEPLPKMIESAIRHREKRSKTGNVNYASVIRETLKMVDIDLRFRYVKYLSCYVNVLSEVLRENSLGQYLRSVPNLTLYMELGASSQSMLSLVELGISRISASLAVESMLDKSMELPRVAEWLLATDPETLDLPAASIRELVGVRESLTDALP